MIAVNKYFSLNYESEAYYVIKKLLVGDLVWNMVWDENISVDIRIGNRLIIDNVLESIDDSW